MQLRWSVVGPRGDVTDVVLTAPAGTPFASVESALRARCGAPDGAPLCVDGVRIAGRASLGVPPLVDGATVRAGRPTGARRPPVGLQLRVVGGPDAGRSVALEPGACVVGRAVGADLPVDDPDVSRAHAEVLVGWDDVSVRDLRSTNGTWLDGREVGPAPEPLWPGARLRVGSTTLELVEATAEAAATHHDGAGRVLVNRPPRLPPVRLPVEITLPTVPVERDRPRLPVVALVVPLLAGVALAAVLRAPSFLLFTLLTPVLLLGQWLSDRSSRARELRAARDRYAERIAAAEDRVAVAVQEERTARHLGEPDPAEVLVAAALPSVRLWERGRADEDALAVRLGLADRAAEVRVTEPGRDPASPPRPAPRLVDVPVTVPLRTAGPLGVAGPRAAVLRTGRWVLGQLATLHSPRDLSIVVLAPTSPGDWAWARWLPHLRPQSGEDCAALLASDGAQFVARTSELVAQLEARRAVVGGRSLPWRGRRTVVLIDGSAGVRADPGVARLLAEGTDVGLHAVWLAGAEADLPAECGARAVVAGPSHTSLRVDVRGQPSVREVSVDGVSAAWADRLARALAASSDATPDETSSRLPDRARLLDVRAGSTRAELPTPDDVVHRWTGGGASTAAVIGVTADEAFVLDLERDGPHVLVAGTTGSGKSELLQTLVASLALDNRPDELAFLLVDYKGGAAFASCSALPHTAGVVTDLDGPLTGRALASLQAELRRRERLLAATGSASLTEHRARSGGRLARLVVVVDEFATLAEELPEFVRGLVGVAQRGRSLGVHLVLATQRPSGVVSADIRANTSTRIALRTTDAAESQDVVDAPDAARLPRRTPGRAVARRGTEPLVTFQSARVGGVVPASAEATAVDVRDLAWTEWGSPSARPRPPRGPAGDADRTDLDAIVGAVAGATRRSGITPPSPPWLPPLPVRVEAHELGPLEPPRDSGAGPVLPYAIADLPDEQARRVVALDLARAGSVLAVGGPRSGRTTLLLGLAAAAAARTSPADVHVHAVDGGRGLAPLAGLAHTGAVVGVDAPERVDRLLSRLLQECARRGALLAEGGFEDVAQQRAAAAAPERLPYLLVLLDRWESFVGALEEVDAGRLPDAVLRLLREGPAAGVSVVVTADRSGLTGRLAALVGSKLVLRLPDRADVTLAGLDPRRVPADPPPGRAVRASDGVELQVALPAPVPATSREAARGPRPFRLVELPERAERASTLEGWTPRSALSAVVGLGGDDARPQGVDLAADGPAFVIGGPARSGRSTALVTVAHGLLRAGAELVLVAPRRSPLRECEGLAGVRALVDSGSASERFAAATAADGPLAVLVDDAELLVDTGLAAQLEDYVRRAHERDRALVAAGTTNDMLAGFRGFLVDARRSRCGLVLSPQSVLDGDLLGVRLARTALGGVRPGRGVLAVRGVTTTVQVAC